MSSAPDPSPEKPALDDQENVLDHEYDGIQEYDNPMPRWWVNVFWATFVFSLGYLFHYHLTGKGTSVSESYALDVQHAREEEARRALGDKVSEESLAKLMLDANLMADAKKTFDQNCGACHSDQGKGLIGPNLTDDYWLHGEGTLMNIHDVVADGVTAKGMPAWGRQLSPMELRKVVAYVGTLRGKRLQGKAPEGKKIERHESSALGVEVDSRAASLHTP